MKVKSSVKLICKHCVFTKKKNKIFVRCIANPKHKQRQLFSTLIGAGNLNKAKILNFEKQNIQNFKNLICECNYFSNLSLSFKEKMNNEINFSSLI